MGYSFLEIDYKKSPRNPALKESECFCGLQVPRIEPHSCPAFTPRYVQRWFFSFKGAFCAIFWDSFFLWDLLTFEYSVLKFVGVSLSEYYFIKDALSIFQKMGEIPVFRLKPDEEITSDDLRLLEPIQCFIKELNSDMVLNKHKYSSGKLDELTEYALCLYLIYCNDSRDWETLLEAFYHESGGKYGIKEEIGKDGQPVFWETVH